jgi:hypothetical protein
LSSRSGPATDPGDESDHPTPSSTPFPTGIMAWATRAIPDPCVRRLPARPGFSRRKRSRRSGVLTPWPFPPRDSTRHNRSISGLPALQR